MTSIEVTRLPDVKIAQSISGLMFGGSGVGKTFFCGTAGSRTAIIDCGASPLATLQSRTFKEKVGAEPLIVKVRDELILSKNKKRIPTGHGLDDLVKITNYVVDEYGDEIDTVCWDCITAVNGWAMVKAFELNAGMSKGGGKENLLTHGIIEPEVQDYKVAMGLIYGMIADAIEYMEAVGKHFIVTAHERREYSKPLNAKGKPIIGARGVLEAVKPGFFGQTFPDDIPSVFSEVWHFSRTGSGESTVVQAQTVRDAVVTAKTTHGSGILRPLETNPNFLQMLARIKAGKAPVALNLRR